MRRILILGGSGFIGSHLGVALRRDNEVIATYYRNPIRIDGVTPLRLSLLDPDAAVRWFRILRPSVTIYASAIISDAEIQRDPMAALRLNSEIPAILAEEVRRIEGTFIYLSTSKVFPGDGNGFYSEMNEPRPNGGYGKTKRQAEQVFELTTGAYTLRLGTIFGVGHFRQTDDVFYRILDGLWREKPQRLIFDEYRSFFSVHGVVRAVERILASDHSTSGLYHLATNEKNSYYSFGKTLANAFGFSAESLTAIKGVEFAGQLATYGGARGSDLSLDGKKFCETFSVNWEPLTESLKAIRKQLARSVPNADVRGLLRPSGSQ